MQDLGYEELGYDSELGPYTQPTRPTQEDQSSYIAGLYAGILENRMVCTIADETGANVGHASIFPKGDYAEGRYIGSLGRVVRTEYRGRGSGNRLQVQTLTDRRGKFEIVELAVTSTNEVARHRYPKYGFEEHGLPPRSFKRGSVYLDEILMSRPVDPAN